jgi:hypothetical protein
VGEICSTGTRQLRHWDRARDDRIMAAYGLPAGAHPDWEIDHLVPLGIGEADAQANLWPEPRGSIEAQWNAEAKDRLESRRTASPVPAGRFTCPPSLRATFRQSADCVADLSARSYCDRGFRTTPTASTKVHAFVTRAVISVPAGAMKSKVPDALEFSLP